MSTRVALPLVVLSLALSCPALELGQRDSFQDGTTQFWEGGANPTNIPSGGPFGAGDAFCSIESIGGGGPGSRLAAFNLEQWVGDYRANGIRSLDLHLNNPSDRALLIRVVLFGPQGSRFTSINPVRLAPGQEWTWGNLPLHREALIRVLGNETWDQVITGVSRLMIRHDDEPPSSGGSVIVARLGFDNVLASEGPTAIPTSARAVRGVLVGGGLNSLAFVDGDRAVIQQRPPFLVSDPSVRLVVEAPVYSPTPNGLSFVWRGSCNLIPGSSGRQTIEIFNLVRNEWVVLDERTPSTSEQTIVVSRGGDAPEFIDPITRVVQARVSVFDRGALFPGWSVSTDRSAFVVRID
jgi:hypothetical protein